MKKLTTEEFISRARNVHKDKYSYERTKYINYETKVLIHCNNCGNDFLQTPHDHLGGHGCFYCGVKNSHSEKKLTTEEFISRAQKVHKDKYSYEKTKYVNSKTKVCIICNTCNSDFFQEPNVHLTGHGCPYCANNKTKTTEQFIREVKKFFPKYNYSKVNYINSSTKVCIICEKHGEFFARPSDLLKNHGCPKCNSSKGERIILKWLNENGFIQGEDFIYQMKFSDCKDKGLLSFDFYFPKKKLLLEYDGIQHFEVVKNFGGEKSFQARKKRDKIKEKYAQNNNLLLERISYKDDILQNLEKILK